MGLHTPCRSCKHVHMMGVYSQLLDDVLMFYLCSLYSSGIQNGPERFLHNQMIHVLI